MWRTASRPDFLDLIAFTFVGETRSITNAAEQLSASKSAVSQRLSRLEDTLRVQLVNRTTRGLVLTACGERLLLGCVDLREHYLQTLALVKSTKAVGDGRLCVFVEPCLAPTVAGDAWAAFVRGWPQMQIRLTFGHAPTGDEGALAGLVLRADVPRQQTIVAARLGELRGEFCVSPTLMQVQGGLPDRLAALADWPHVALMDDGDNVRYEDGVSGEAIEVIPRSSASSIEMVADLVKSGVGFGCLPHPLVSRLCNDGHVVRVLPAFAAWRRPVFACHHYGSRTPHIIRALIEHVRSVLEVSALAPATHAPGRECDAGFPLAL